MRRRRPSTAAMRGRWTQVARLVLLVAVASSALADEGSDTGETERKRVPAPYIEVFSWLSVGPGPNNITTHFNRAADDGAMFEEGTFAYTGGGLRNAGHIRDLFGQRGLRMISIGYGDDGVAAVRLFVLRDQIEALIRSYTSKFELHSPAIKVADGRGENEDRYVLFDLSWDYVAEIAVPQHGTFCIATFATRDVYEQMRGADGRAELLLPYLTYWTEGPGSEYEE